MPDQLVHSVPHHRSAHDLQAIGSDNGCSHFDVDTCSDDLAHDGSCVKDSGYLADTSLRKFRETNKMDDLKDAVEQVKAAIEANHTCSFCQATQRSNLAYLLFCQYQRHDDTDNTGALDNAISEAKQSLGITNDKKFQGGLHMSILNNLGGLYLTRYEKTESPEDLCAALSYAGKAVKASPKDDPNFPGRQGNLSKILFEEYERTHDDQSLDQAISKAREAVEMLKSQRVPQCNLDAHPLRAIKRRFSMNSASRSEMHGQVNLGADDGEKRQRQVLVDLRQLQQLLGTMLMRRYEQGRHQKDLEEANAIVNELDE